MPNPESLRLALAKEPELLPLFARLAEVPAEVVRDAAEHEHRMSQAQWLAIGPTLAAPPSERRQFALAHLKTGTAPPLKAQRQRNLRRLLSERGAGQRLASLMGMAPPSVSGLISANKNQAFGGNIARKIERTLQLEAGWLEQDEPAIPDTAAELLARKAIDEPVTAGSPPPVSPVTPRAAVLPAPLPGIHGLVEQRYRQLVHDGKVSERRAYELLGELMALDSPSP
jgi:hypothetical protein